MNKVLLLLGSNIGRREENILKCLNEMESSFLQIEDISSIYLTTPEGVSFPHPDYFNMAVLAQTHLYPRELLSATAEVERKLGRRSKGDLSPRIIDIDILLYDDLEILTPVLRLPHPQIFERNFVIHIISEIGFSHFPAFEGRLLEVLRTKPKPSGMRVVVKKDYIVRDEEGWRITTSER